MDTQSKVMTAQQAISTYLHSGDCLALGGFVTNRRPYGLVWEILRQGIHDIYLEGGSSGGDIDMLIGAGRVRTMMVSYIANSGYTMVCRRFREAVEQGRLQIEDFSIDVQTIAYHGAALGLSYVPIKNMLGSDLANKWGISEEERKKAPQAAPQKVCHPGGPLPPRRAALLRAHPPDRRGLHPCAGGQPRRHLPHRGARVPGCGHRHGPPSTPSSPASG